MFALAETRFHFVGDEYIYAEISREMALTSTFKALAITRDLHKQQIPGVIDICPANTSYLIRYNPEIISPSHLLDCLKEIDSTKSNPTALNLPSRIVEIPTWYNDPLTQQYARQFKERSGHDSLSDFEFVMKSMGFKEEQALIDAHTRTPHLITMIGFILGTAWEFPLGLSPEKIIDVPKYISPRTKTPKQAVGVGGAFTAIYPVESSGSYQLIGITPVPVYDPEQKLKIFADTFFLANPGDIWVHRPIEETEYFRILSQVEQGTYPYRTKKIEFSPEQYFREGNLYIHSIMKGF